eukprot:4319062-Alexandrium_andersonii.AAC.1
MAGTTRDASACRRTGGHCRGAPVPGRAVRPRCGREHTAGPKVNSLDELGWADSGRAGPQVRWWAPAHPLRERPRGGRGGVPAAAVPGYFPRR